jgi:hypothetical protein
MRKLFVTTLALMLPLMAVSACDDQKVCKPLSVRQDAVKPGTWWSCNSDGTAETPMQGPIPNSPIQ